MTGLIRKTASRVSVSVAIMAGCALAAPVCAQPVAALPAPTSAVPGTAPASTASTTTPAAAAASAAPAPAPAAAAAAAADDYPPPEEAQAAPDINPVAITTLATGTKLSFDKLAQPVTVITQDDIDRIQGGNFTRFIALFPGATWERRGGPGAQTALHLRGASADEVLVVIDGVRMQDVGAPDGGFDFGTLTGAGVDRIDVLRGTNSVVWGSGAIGGVVAVTTRETKGIVATAEIGGHDSVLQNIAFGIRKDRYALALDGGYIATDGTDGASNEAAGGFHQWRLGGRGRFSVTDTLALNATARFADTKLTGDDFALPPELSGALPEGLRTQQVSGRIGAHFERGRVTLDGGYALSTTLRVYDLDPATDPANHEAQARWRGTSERIDVIGAVRLPADFKIDFGADDERLRAHDSITGSGVPSPQRRARIDSGHVLVGWYGAAATLSAGLRIDNSSQFGTHDSFNASGSAQLHAGLRLRASYAQGFKAPSLYQSYSLYGQPALVPETARSYDAGLDYTAMDGRIRLSATAYRRDSRNLIALIGCAIPASAACIGHGRGIYTNIGAARADGVELEAALVPSAKWRLAALYSYDRATNRTTGDPNRGKDLPRRPHHALTSSVDWTSPFGGLVLGADLRVQSNSWDDAGNTVRLHTSELTAVRATLPFGNFLDIYARFENLFNDHHPTVAGYSTVGRELLVGARIRY